MNILALDTSMGVCAAAVLRTAPSEDTEVWRESAMARGHAEALMPMVETVLAEACVTPDALDTIAATQGPGSFTGVRIAIAAARGLALTSGASLYGTDSLTVMAHRAIDDGLRPSGSFAVAADARRGMIYFGLFGPDGSQLDGPRLLSPADAAGGLQDDTTMVIGSGAELLQEAAAEIDRQLDADLPSLQPGAKALAELAAEDSERVPVLRPLYLRPPDAKPQKKALERRT